jgi:SAM-dependent methyltransferase
VNALRESAGLSLEIQRRLGEVDNYNRWIYEQFAPYVGKRVLDVGSALGNITELFLDREHVVGIDVVAEFAAELDRRFGNQTNFRVELADISDPAVTRFAEERFDTIVCANVLEHVEDDAAALHHMHEILVAGGHACLLVPAFGALFGTLDEVDDHFRRYNRPILGSRLEAAGFQVVNLHYMNVLGIVGWILNGKILRRRLVPRGQYSLYNRLVPLLALVERRLRPPFGLSLVAIARKPV